MPNLSPLVSVFWEFRSGSLIRAPLNSHHMSLQLTAIFNNFPPVPRLLALDLHNLAAHLMDMYSAAVP